MLRDTIKAAQITAMKAGDKPRLAAVRLILAKLKDKDIELRPSIASGAAALPDDDVLVTDVLQKMAKQRRESITMFVQGGRQELADIEQAELAVIEEFMPIQMGEDETRAAIAAIIAELGAAGMKDMGKVVGALKAQHGTQLDMGKASGLVKAALG
ncbi:MAG: GatB/YqeY domain-containing protein [Novosphingobium sp.]|uniref:GatB/YqeY domain-containing protein n=1 Tax=Novosphingobium sp. TaxID=1874826 RepID=UPI0032BC7A21